VVLQSSLELLYPGSVSAGIRISTEKVSVSQRCVPQGVRILLQLCDPRVEFRDFLCLLRDDSFSLITGGRSGGGAGGLGLLVGIRCPTPLLGLLLPGVQITLFRLAGFLQLGEFRMGTLQFGRDGVQALPELLSGTRFAEALASCSFCRCSFAFLSASARWKTSKALMASGWKRKVGALAGS
jgi:hypothetical protein